MAGASRRTQGPKPVEAGADPEADQVAAGADPEESQPDPSAAAVSSPGFSGADPFVGDPGHFDADDQPEPGEDGAAPLAGPELADIVWDATRIRRVLTLQGTATHALIGVAATDWVWQPGELDLVCGPLADYANRTPALAAMAHLSDDAAVAAGFASYLLRSWRERVRALRALADETPHSPSVTGRVVADDTPTQETAWTIPEQ